MLSQNFAGADAAATPTEIFHIARGSGSLRVRVPPVVLADLYRFGRSVSELFLEGIPMLVLQRTPWRLDGPRSEVRLTIPPSTEPRTITVRLCEARESRAQLGFTADRDVEILRTELIDAA